MNANANYSINYKNTTTEVKNVEFKIKEGDLKNYQAVVIVASSGRCQFNKLLTPDTTEIQPLMHPYCSVENISIVYLNSVQFKTEEPQNQFKMDVDSGIEVDFFFFEDRNDEQIKELLGIKK